jgi:hypothetical protein
MKQLLIAAHEQKQPRTTRKRKRVGVGWAMLKRIKTQHGLFSGRGDIRHQLNLTDKTREVARLFLHAVVRAYQQVGANMLLCADETFWPLVPQPTSLLKARMGRDSVRVDTHS